MKRLIYMLITVGLLLQGCGKDNYDEPTSELSGNVTFNGLPLNLKGTGESVQLKLYQPGYELNAEVPVYVSQDGSFKVKIFDGKYKLVARENNGPWVNISDTVNVDLRGSVSVNYEVNPYFLVNSASLSLSSDNKLTGNFTINKNVPSATLDYYTVLVSKTAFVDDVSNFYRKDYTSVSGETIQVLEDLSENETIKTEPALFARIGVRANQADQAIYSEVIKIK